MRCGSEPWARGPPVSCQASLICAPTHGGSVGDGATQGQVAGWVSESAPGPSLRVSVACLSWRL